MENTVKNILGKQIYPSFSWLDDNEDDETKEVSESDWDDEARTNQTFPHNVAKDNDEFKEDVKDVEADEALADEDEIDDFKSNGVDEENGSNEFSHKLEKVIEGARRILQKIRKSLQKNDKFSIQQTQKDIDYLFNKLDRASVEINGSKEQFERIEKLFDEVGEVTESNIKMRIAINEEEERRLQLPKACLMKWGGNDEDFLDFRDHMMCVLRYGDQALNLSSLKAQIEDNSEKGKILSKIENCKNVQEAFATLEQFYGNFNIIQAKMRAKLENLPDCADDEDLSRESHNVEAILNYMTKMRKFGQERKYVDADFIHRFMHKLSPYRMMKLIDTEMTTGAEFESYLNKILVSNQKILLTKPQH